MQWSIPLTRCLPQPPLHCGARSPIGRRKKLLANVWCTRCGAVTTITAYHGAVVKGDLVLTGVCSTCGGPVRRLIETGG